MKKITQAMARTIARNALIEASKAPESYRISVLHQEVNAALADVGYRPCTVLSIDGSDVRSVAGVAAEIYNCALRERAPAQAEARIERKQAAWRAKVSKSFA